MTSLERSSQQVHDFLSQAAQSDVLREQLMAQPAEVLARFGFDVEGTDIPEQVVLPEKDALLAGLKYFANAEDEPDKAIFVHYGYFTTQ